jgi:hypothetical protein
MIAPFVVFALTGIVLLRVHQHCQIPLFRAISLLNNASQREGSTWSYWYDLRARLRLVRNPTALFRETDSPTVRALKQEVAARHRAALQALPKMVAILLGGFVLCVISAILELIIRGTRS